MLRQKNHEFRVIEQVQRRRCHIGSLFRKRMHFVKELMALKIGKINPRQTMNYDFLVLWRLRKR